MSIQECEDSSWSLLQDPFLKTSLRPVFRQLWRHPWDVLWSISRSFLKPATSPFFTKHLQDQFWRHPWRLAIEQQQQTCTYVDILLTHDSPKICRFHRWLQKIVSSYILSSRPVSCHVSKWFINQRLMLFVKVFGILTQGLRLDWK